MVTRAEVTDLAEKALVHIAGDPDLAGAMMEASGLQPGDLRRAVADPAFAEGVLDLLCQTDERLIAFSEFAGIRPERVAHIRAALEAGRVD